VLPKETGRQLKSTAAVYLRPDYNILLSLSAVLMPEQAAALLPLLGLNLAQTC
jgi:hypothetical protein